MNIGDNAAAELRHGIETIEDLDDQIQDLNDQIKALKTDRKFRMASLRAAGFMPKAVTAMIGERKMDARERREYHATLQTYRAMLGMLDGTPLGDAARRAFQESNDPRKPPEEKAAKKKPPEEMEDRGEPLPFDPAGEQAEPGPEEPTAAQIATAREEGSAAARASESVLANPYPAMKEILRAAWDEGWCSECGNDGMEIPKELRRRGGSKKSEEAREDAA